MPVNIRSGVPGDVPALLAIEREAGSAAHWTHAQYERCAAEGFIFVAEEEESVRGFVCAREAAGVWEIENIVVAAGSRRCGIGDRLVVELLRRAQDHAGTAVWLEVRESNHPARGLYKKHGFRETGRRRGYYSDPVEDAVLYEVRLESGRDLRG